MVSDRRPSVRTIIGAAFGVVAAWVLGEILADAGWLFGAALAVVLGLLWLLWPALAKRWQFPLAWRGFKPWRRRPLSDDRKQELRRALNLVHDELDDAIAALKRASREQRMEWSFHLQTSEWERHRELLAEQSGPVAGLRHVLRDAYREIKEVNASARQRLDLEMSGLTPGECRELLSVAANLERAAIRTQRESIRLNE